MLKFEETFKCHMIFQKSFWYADFGAQEIFSNAFFWILWIESSKFSIYLKSKSFVTLEMSLLSFY